MAPNHLTTRSTSSKLHRPQHTPPHKHLRRPRRAGTPTANATISTFFTPVRSLHPLQAASLHPSIASKLLRRGRADTRSRRPSVHGVRGELLLRRCGEGGARLRERVVGGGDGGHGQRRRQLVEDLQVAVGAAEALVHLHHEASPSIIHRDIKASNVLLDSDFAPLVADFGFAKLVPDGVSHMTTRVKGTLGYLAPEYAMWGKVSGACDVYSFGILLVELVSGRKPIERLPSGAKRTITEWAEPLIARGRLGDLVDPRLRGIYDAAELARMLEAAALCVQGEPERRPDMRAVVRILRGETVAPDGAAAAASKGGNDAQVRPAVRMESVKYADHLMETENSVYSGDGDEDDQEDEKEAADYSSDEVEEYSLMDDQSSMNFGVFGAMPVVPVQTMHDPYVRRFGGNGVKI
ncbi:putative proline-rich receptor-like protein kinase PERK6 [Triticum aestivum]|uniref:putative proline-rich receptor-like protein kinase PERK6 n=1 Tax=Triticum aestivum TaxID=4565 RepID=UPI001D0298D9|nr:putative proline-rich receptor-like protein kinase PERK6 [Triticum aestivum]